MCFAILVVSSKFAMSPIIAAKKEGFRITTLRLPALFVRSSTLCLPIKALLFFSFNRNVMRSCYCAHEAVMFEVRIKVYFLHCLV